MRIIPLMVVLIGLVAPDILQGQRSYLYVSPNGKDTNPGTPEAPLATWSRAVKWVRSKNKSVTVYFRAGVYHLSSTTFLGPEDSGDNGKKIIYAAYRGEKVIISGAARLEGLNWELWKDGIYRTKPANKPDKAFDQLFVNGVRQVRARFPNYDYANPLRSGKGYQEVRNGSDQRTDSWLEYDPAIFSRKKWADPTTGIVHAFQSRNWGNRQYRIKSVDTLQHRILLGEGGWQMQREGGIGRGRGAASPFFVENILEELDVPGEWFYDEAGQWLYYYPFPGMDLQDPKTNIEVVHLDQLVKITGSHIVLQGFHFTQTRTDFMEPHEPVGRGDWAIHRGGAVLLEGAEDCSVRDCAFEYVGGNAVFMNKYNRRDTVSGCRFFHTGESGVCFVGDTGAVRSYMTWDDEQVRNLSWSDKRRNMSVTPGPGTPDYPEDCVVENCIASELGDFGKQVAAVFISMSHRIRVSHTTIYNVPRAAICINDGTWGGHRIEYCDIWEAVRETGEHGPFNAWGRDRYWLGSGDLVKREVLLDAVEPTIIRNNRIANYRKSISAGNWTMDLDDGSSNYLIYNNLSLGSTLKLRDGYYRKVWNNIFVSAVPLGWHVWPDSSEDEFIHNITVIAGEIPGSREPTTFMVKPIGMPANGVWGKQIDSNLYYNFNDANSHTVANNPPPMSPGIDRIEWQGKGYDRHSVFANPLFKDPLKGDYQVSPGSPAQNIGFKNFRMDDFGHHMTRIVPFGGEFDGSNRVRLLPDDRGGIIHYTTDGSVPTIGSAVYSKPLLITRTTTLRAQTFRHGLPVGFETLAVFSKVDRVSYPSWLAVLLGSGGAGKDDSLRRVAGKGAAGRGESRSQEVKRPQPQKKSWMGAILTDIADGDMIDAAGGAEKGVFLEKVPAVSAASRQGFRAGDILLKIDETPISDIRDFENAWQSATTGAKKIVVRRGYLEIAIMISKK